MRSIGGRYTPRSRPGPRGPRGDKGDPGVTAQPKDDGSIEIAPTDDPAPVAIAVPAPPVPGSISWTENADGTYGLLVTPEGTE